MVRAPGGIGVFIAPGFVLAATGAGLSLMVSGNDDSRYAVIADAIDEDDELAAL